MSKSLNKVQLIGNLTRDPEIRSFSNGDRVASIGLATNEKWKDKNTGEPKEQVQYHRIEVKNQNLIKICEEYLKKGSRAHFEGKLVYRDWTDKDGNERTSSEIVISGFGGDIILLS